MKKILRLIFITAVFMLTALFSLTAQAANKEVYRFADVAEYNGEVYAHSWMDSSFDDCLSGNVSVKWLPEKLEDQINSKRYNALIDFTIYNGKIYYRAGSPCGADDCIESIYVCDLDGSNNTLIADNADNHTNIYIVDNYLYYSSMRPYEDSLSPHPEADGGLYKVNLDDLSITALVEPSGVVSNGARLCYCDGYHVYYAYTKARFLYDENAESAYYISDINGYNAVEIPHSSMKFYLSFTEYIWGDRKYYIKDGVMYEESKSDGSVKEIYETGEGSGVQFVTNRYIYYSVGSTENGNKVSYVYRADRPNPDVTVYFNNEKMEFGETQKAVMTEGCVMVPMRTVFEALGADVSWNSSAKTIAAEKGGTCIYMTVGSSIMTIVNSNSGETQEIDMSAAPEQLSDGYTIVPVRAVSEALNAEVSWDEASRSVYISYSESILNVLSRVFSKDNKVSLKELYSYINERLSAFLV